MKVLMVTTFFPDTRHPYSGIFLARQVAVLRDLGVDAEVLRFVPAAPWPLPLMRSRWRALAGVPSRYDLNGLSVSVRRLLTLPRNLSLALSVAQMEWGIRGHAGEAAPDVIHAHLAYPTGLAAVRAGKRLGVPVIISVHGSDLNVVPHLRAGYRRGVRAALGEASNVLTVSDDLREKVLALRPDAATVTHRIGIDLTLFKPMPREQARKSIPGLGDTDAPIALYVGNLLATKGVADLLAAAAVSGVDGLRVVIAGDGPLRSEIADRGRELGLGSRLHMLGALPHGLIPTLLSAADVLVLPSHSEGLPTVCVEALACMCPVIASSAGGTPEIIRHGATGLLFPPGDVAALAAALRRVLVEDSGLGPRLSLAGRELVNDRYDIRVNTRELVSMLRASAGGCVR